MHCVQESSRTYWWGYPGTILTVGYTTLMTSYSSTFSFSPLFLSVSTSSSKFDLFHSTIQTTVATRYMLCRWAVRLDSYALRKLPRDEGCPGSSQVARHAEVILLRNGALVVCSTMEDVHDAHGVPFLLSPGSTELKLTFLMPESQNHAHIDMHKRP